MAENFYRLVCFVVNICSEPLRGLFLKYAKSESGMTFTTLDAYLAQKKNTILRLYHKRKIRDDQFDLLYPQGGIANESQWDVTLLVTLTTELFSSSLQGWETFLINEIRDIRNKLQHLPNTSGLSDTDYDDYWKRLETATLFLAKEVGGSVYEHEMTNRITNTKVINFPYLVESLRVWYEENKKQMSKTMEEMKKTIEDMKTEMEEMKVRLVDSNCNTKETLTTLQKVTVAKEGPAGRTVKRMKTVDGILSKLRANYERTVKMELRNDFISPPEVSEIRTVLRDKHHVVVTGYDNSRYLETALAAIKGMEYNPARCVEMSVSSDWRHIDPEDVDFVLCRDPFGRYYYDEKKTKSIADILNNMLYTSEECDAAERIDIVLVTDFSVLTEVKQYHQYDILEEVVKVFDSTTENQPADLTMACDIQDCAMARSFCPNIKEMTELFLLKHVDTSNLVDSAKLQLAKTKFQIHKIVVITGPRRCGKTSLAVTLIKSYNLTAQSMLLYKPSDVQYIDLKSPCLVIIDEFAGKYRYEEDDVFKWYKAFDVLHDATTAGKINVIITCQKEKLEKCCKEIVPHELLEHRVDLSDNVIVIKEEAATNTALYNDEIVDLPSRWTMAEEVKIEEAGNSVYSTFTDTIDFEQEFTKKRKRKDKGEGRGRKTRAAKRERLVEEKVKPYACEICNARYKTGPGLLYHHNIFHIDMPEPEKPESSPNSDEFGERQNNIYCDFCLGISTDNRKTGTKEEQVFCSDCGRSAHPTCLQFPTNIITSVKQYPWQCLECKSCGLCGTSENDAQFLLCDDCDRGYHMYCLNPPLSEAPEGNWSCHLCIEEFHGGQKPAGMN